MLLINKRVKEKKMKEKILKLLLFENSIVTSSEMPVASIGHL